MSDEGKFFWNEVRKVVSTLLPIPSWLVAKLPIRTRVTAINSWNVEENAA